MLQNLRISPNQQLALGATCIAFAPILVKTLDQAPSVIAFYRTLLASLILLPFCRVEIKRVVWRSNRSFWLFIVLGGLSFTCDLAVWHRSIFYTGAGIATILGNMQVFCTGLVGLWILKEPLEKSWFVGALFGLLGVALLVGAFENLHTGPHFFKGVVFGLLTAPFYTAYIFSLRQIQSYRAKPNALCTLWFLLLSASLFSAILAAVEGNSFIIEQSQWLNYFLLALVPQVAGWALITQSLPKVPLAFAGLLLLIQPVFAFMLGVVLFDERFSFLQVLGAILTISAIYIASISKKTKPKT